MAEMEKRRTEAMRSAGESCKEIVDKLHNKLAGVFCTNPGIFLRLNYVGKNLFSTRVGEENGSD